MNELAVGSFGYSRVPVALLVSGWQNWLNADKYPLAPLAYLAAGLLLAYGIFLLGRCLSRTG